MLSKQTSAPQSTVKFFFGFLEYVAVPTATISILLLPCAAAVASKGPGSALRHGPHTAHQTLKMPPPNPFLFRDYKADHDRVREGGENKNRKP